MTIYFIGRKISIKRSVLNVKYHGGCPRNPTKNDAFPQKVLWYFPLKPRLQRLYMSQKKTAEMRWHVG